MIRRVLIVDDDRNLSGVVATALGDEGFEVELAHDGAAGLRRFEASAPDLVVLDVLMPEMDGLEVCRRIRRTSAVPIILLTSRADEVDRVNSLDTGADDYVTKPFSVRELCARIRALGRRLERRPPAAPAAGATEELGDPEAVPIEAGPLRLDPARFEVRWRGKPVTVTVSEWQVLAVLVRHRGRVLARERLLDLMRGDVAVTERTVDTFVKRLRKKLREVDREFDEIETVFGVGYRYKGS